MKARLAADSHIVNNPKLESVIIRIISGLSLSQAERAECEQFKAAEEAPASPARDGASLIAQAFKKRRVARKSVYIMYGGCHQHPTSASAFSRRRRSFILTSVSGWTQTHWKFHVSCGES
ncbi:TPA: hypothetical protein N0F65_003574 [Lagenidium giganteum]|uniref:Uncharacterized protein n=1 Tax=Lagenidium giganteum TaxID=4803 RepID=A0AAV2Z4B4_9STRA|nr:TPA: hypothetical protein N0F65_003574 [Lagenidium giganteum]